MVKVMSYENKEYILQFFEGVHEKDNKAELLEVYRKAKAFDAILKAYDEAFSREHMAGEVSNIIEKYESGESDA